MTAEMDRPQDVGRRHVRKRTGGDRALIERWHGELRTVLERCITELAGNDRGIGLDGKPLPRDVPTIGQATDLVKLGTLVSRELGGAIDPAPAGRPEAAGRARPAPRSVKYE